MKTSSRKTDRLLKRAEREKEDYADQDWQRISQEKQREIQVMMDKLSEITKESEDLLKDAAKDKEAFADQIRKQMTEERNREMNKQAYRIEVLTSEKETLEKRIDAFEQEIAWTWQEQEKNIEKITCLSWVELVQNEGALSVTTTGSAKQDTRMRMENRETIRKVPAHRSMKIFVTLLVFLMVIFQQKRKI